MSPRKPTESLPGQTLPPADGLSFESAIAELETLIQSVESNRLPLEETLNAYQRGQQLIGRCSTLLRDAEQRLQQFDGQSLTDITLVDRP